MPISRAGLTGLMRVADHVGAGRVRQGAELQLLQPAIVCGTGDTVWASSTPWSARMYGMLRRQPRLAGRGDRDLGQGEVERLRPGGQQPVEAGLHEDRPLQLELLRERPGEVDLEALGEDHLAALGRADLEALARQVHPDRQRVGDPASAAGRPAPERRPQNPSATSASRRLMSARSP